MKKVNPSGKDGGAAPSPVLTLVVAYARNRVIGRDNALPWKLPGDLAHFKRTTLGHPIVMGRKTWESLGRPLPGRRNIVISRDPAYAAAGAEVVGSLPAALAACADVAQVCVIGGAQIYAAALPLAQRIVATEVQADVEGDAWFPPLPADEWREISRQAQPGENGYAYDFVEYERNQAGQRQAG
ncbi:dihydrofolate reductase [Achromobacter aloeverae]|uniref:Dihydrofolate reductase n=1 Tax=Achromobacter aloeverae TaxID=1750518 RepID=A0A4Q1HK76_9BURK|nr:dihydrofolate reductase [Achromobacter aloeverae]RXN90524.1 dihydrofolate reductase [Achromobacter aloeverae]